MASQRELIKAVEEGFVYFWTRPDKPWRNKIYEANIFASAIKDQHSKQNVEGVSGQKEDLPRERSGLRDMWVQSNDPLRLTS